MAEALLRQMSGGRIQVVSAGSLPCPEIHPLARKAVKDLFGLDMEGQYPKSLDQFLGQRLDYVISVCDRADASCPIFPGDTERIHWSFEDPAAVEGTEEEKRRAFEGIARDLMGRIRIWLALPNISRRAGGSTIGRAI
jgi:arsenate reductase